MTPDEAFLGDIIEHPDDDTPRLVYSDWLEEHGKEAGRARAEFIRLQIELEPLRLPRSDPRAELERVKLLRGISLESGEYDPTTPLARPPC